MPSIKIQKQKQNPVDILCHWHLPDTLTWGTTGTLWYYEFRAPPLHLTNTSMCCEEGFSSLSLNSVHFCQSPPHLDVKRSPYVRACSLKKKKKNCEELALLCSR